LWLGNGIHGPDFDMEIPKPCHWWWAVALIRTSFHLRGCLKLGGYTKVTAIFKGKLNELE